MDKQFALGVIVMITLVSTLSVTPILLQQQAGALAEGHELSAAGTTRPPGTEQVKAPIVTSGDNIYITWWTNKTGNNEVMFRASTDNGATFGDKINLSNSTKSESRDAQIAASGDRVFITWWERNQTVNEPILRISNDNGKTFGEILKLASNKTMSGG
jgi:hypothetical protein